MRRNTASCYRRDWKSLPCRPKKFRQLRFYVNGDDEFVAGLTWVASALSAGIYEQCGKPAIVRGQGLDLNTLPWHGGPTFQKSILRRTRAGI